jgi:hypothetical protein
MTRSINGGNSFANGNGETNAGGPSRHQDWQLPPREHWWTRA